MIDGAQGSRLASIQPAAATIESAFVATMDTEVGRIFVCNTSGATTFRIYHSPPGTVAPLAVEALYFDAAIGANETVDIVASSTNCGIQLKEGDILFVRSGSGNVAFNIYGVTADIAPLAGTV